MKGIYIMNQNNFATIFGENEKSEISNLIEIKSVAIDKNEIMKDKSILKDVDIIFSSWGCPRFDKDFLEAAPNLKAVFYAAGSIKSLVSNELWDRDIVISSAYAANAIPVAEFTLSQIIYGLKMGWQFMQAVKNRMPIPHKYLQKGLYKSTVGVISLGMIGRKVCELLKNFDVNVVAYDPFISAEKAKNLGVSLCSLEELFRSSDVVTIHTPLLEETRGMIGRTLLESMRPNASLINTSRGAIINESELIDVLIKRKDIYAILDVTTIEPPEANSPLYDMDNVILTPHIAGAVGEEGKRMTVYMIEELKRFINNEPLKWRITREMEEHLA